MTMFDKKTLLSPTNNLISFFLVDMSTQETAQNYRGIHSEQLRHLIDKLTQYGVQKYIDLPQLAVMGDTSSGKSSLLSALSGIQFPASDRLTTRCPTQLILSCAKAFSGTAHIQRFEGKGESYEESIDTIDEIPNVISDMTQILVDEGQNISDDAIVIEASGPGFPNLTLTDLPGLVRTVGDGENKSMITKIRRLVDRYLEQSRTIILAIVPANVDMHNTEILQAAEEVDPLGDRTISIITKPDLVDQGAEDAVIKLLCNETKARKLGYHAVRCRGQKDLKNGTSIKDGLQQEKDFFRDTHPWKEINSNLLGIEKLQVKLVRLLEQRIRQSMPSIIDEIRKSVKSAQEMVSEMGPVLRDSAAKRNYYLEVVAKIQCWVHSSIAGHYQQSSLFRDEDVRLRALLRKEDLKFNDTILKLKPEELDKKELGRIMEAIASYRGEELPIFPSYNVFTCLAAEQVSQWRESSEKLLRTYQNLTKYVVSKIVHHEATYSLEFAEFISQHILALIDSLYEITEARLEELLEAELRPSTLNHYFMENLTKLRSEKQLAVIRGIPQKFLHGQVILYLTEIENVLKGAGIANATNEQKEAEEIYMALCAYTKVAQKRFIDVVVRTLDYHFLQKLWKTMRESLDPVSDEHLAYFLGEDPLIESQRDALTAKIKSLEAAQKELYLLK
jgi:GTP-binding protein EngB required for normal cell division